MPHARWDGLSLFCEQEGSADPSLLFLRGWCCVARTLGVESAAVRSPGELRARWLEEIG